jgi:putative two-component system response regulator
MMKRHPEFGVRILGDNPFYEIARQIAAGHHENLDGTGYPKGVKGDEIPLAARIAKAADIFDALTSRRPYKEPWSVEKTLGWMDEQCGTQLDPEVVAAFHQLNDAGTIAQIMSEFHTHDQDETGEFEIPL